MVLIIRFSRKTWLNFHVRMLRVLNLLLINLKHVWKPKNIHTKTIWHSLIFVSLWRGWCPCFVMFQVTYNFKYLQCPIAYIREQKKLGNNVTPMCSVNVSSLQPQKLCVTPHLGFVSVLPIFVLCQVDRKRIHSTCRRDNIFGVFWRFDWSNSATRFIPQLASMERGWRWS